VILIYDYGYLPKFHSYDQPRHASFLNHPQERRTGNLLQQRVIGLVRQLIECGISLISFSKLKPAAILQTIYLVIYCYSETIAVEEGGMAWG
jgi:hypothetical protein